MPEKLRDNEKRGNLGVKFSFVAIARVNSFSVHLRMTTLIEGELPMNRIAVPGAICTTGAFGADILGDHRKVIFRFHNDSVNAYT